MARRITNSPLAADRESQTCPQLLIKAGTVCRVLGGIHRRTLARMEKAGIIRSVSLLRHKLYAVEDVEALVEKARQWKP